MAVWSVLYGIHCVSVGPTEGPIIPGRCGRDEATCQNGQCVPRDYLCDGDFDCGDRSDEADCSEFSLQYNRDLSLQDT